MALVFVSYKRGTDGVIPLRDELQQRHYAVWFDKWSIKVGDIDWQSSIDKGIEDADAFILCLSPDACDLPYVKHEVNQALAKQERMQRETRGGQAPRKFIFPLMLTSLGKNEEIANNLRKLDLPERYQMLDMTTVDSRSTALNDLFEELRKQGIHASLEINRNQDAAQRDLHPNYWRHLSERLGQVDMRPLVRGALGDHAMDEELINPHFDQVRPIEDIYVPIPTDLRMVYDLHNYDIDDWWLLQDQGQLQDLRLECGIDHDKRPTQRMRVALDQEKAQINAAEHTWDMTAIETRVQARRRALYEEEGTDEYRRFGRLDHATEIPWR